ncbi:hypothetical protein RY831_27560 [Noviherbaspirillum sp. CPCC 100848]|uniref:Uncharacterized protein n=1 Tax=Noviherbaspirillum album TaxID=3080276 RepID=A0ABU6JGX9_9BURK|nr:hypothetical protein [Noviherbaspirillum sp. CPCC 100848]MEC4722921.1 hypothetical protein [Noviherbaspirillum sp. CPCC 100848]
MADAWQEVQRAVRALRKQGDIRMRLMEAYRPLLRLRLKDLPSEARHHHEWLVGTIDARTSERLQAEIRDCVDTLSAAQLSEAVHRIVALHEALKVYQPDLPPARKPYPCEDGNA